jgi:hypothetical protein
LIERDVTLRLRNALLSLANDKSDARSDTGPDYDRNVTCEVLKHLIRCGGCVGQLSRLLLPS